MQTNLALSLQLQQVSYAYEDKRILHGIDWTLQGEKLRYCSVPTAQVRRRCCICWQG